ALEATLRIYLNEQQALVKVPVLAMLGLTGAELQRRAEHLAHLLRPLDGLADVQVAPDHAYVGGGSLPDQKMPSWVVALRASEVDDEELARRLRRGTPPVVGRLQDGKLLLDVRTILPEQLTDLVNA